MWSKIPTIKTVSRKKIFKTKSAENFWCLLSYSDNIFMFSEETFILQYNPVNPSNGKKLRYIKGVLSIHVSLLSIIPLEQEQKTDLQWSNKVSFQQNGLLLKVVLGASFLVQQGVQLKHIVLHVSHITFNVINFTILAFNLICNGNHLVISYHNG